MYWKGGGKGGRGMMRLCSMNINFFIVNSISNFGANFSPDSGVDQGGAYMPRFLGKWPRKNPGDDYYLFLDPETKTPRSVHSKLYVTLESYTKIQRVEVGNDLCWSSPC